VRIGPWLGRGCVGLVVVGWLLALVLDRVQYRRHRRPAIARDVPAPPSDRTFA
jgi:apolipoprotein N-acyltransferase